MSTETLPAGQSDGTRTTSRAGELKALVGQLMDHLRLHGAGGQNADQPVPAERSAAAAQAGPSNGILGWLIEMIEAIVADIDIVTSLDKLENQEYAAKKAPIHEVNPSPDYWYRRSDGPGEHHYFEDDHYLRLTIPPAQATAYWNAEVYNNPRTHIQPKNILLNLLPPDDPSDPQERRNWANDLLLNLPYVPENRVVFEGRIRAETLKGGSRGWGFWNMSLSPFTMQVAWFVQYVGVETGNVEPAVPSGFYLQTQNGMNGLDAVFHRLPDLDEEWHDYRIELNGGSVFYFMDGRLVHQVWGPAVPVKAVQFHCWVDNSVFGIAGAGAQHICQNTDRPRSNIIHSMRIASPPHAAADPGSSASVQG